MDGERYRTMMCKLIFTMPKSSLCYSMPPLLTRGAEALQMRTLEANVWLNKRRGGGEYRIWQSHPADALTCFATADLPLFTYCRDTITTVFATSHQTVTPSIISASGASIMTLIRYRVSRPKQIMLSIRASAARGLMRHAHSRVVNWY